MRALANSGAFWALVLLVPIVLFCLPTLIGMVRRVDGLPLVVLFNATGIGWVGAIILAFGPRRRPSAPPAWPPPVSASPPPDWHRFYRITWNGRFRASRIDGAAPLEAATTGQLWDLMREDFHRRPMRYQP